MSELVNENLAARTGDLLAAGGRWHRVRWFHDDEGDLAWKGWQPMDREDTPA